MSWKEKCSCGCAWLAPGWLSRTSESVLCPWRAERDGSLCVTAGQTLLPAPSQEALRGQISVWYSMFLEASERSSRMWVSTPWREAGWRWSWQWPGREQVCLWLSRPAGLSTFPFLPSCTCTWTACASLSPPSPLCPRNDTCLLESRIICTNYLLQVIFPKPGSGETQEYPPSTSSS